MSLGDLHVNESHSSKSLGNPNQNMLAAIFSLPLPVRDRDPDPLLWMLGQIHMNGWSRVIASQNGGSTDYIFPFRLRVLQWSRHLFNY